MNNSPTLSPWSITGKYGLELPIPFWYHFVQQRWACKVKVMLRTFEVLNSDRPILFHRWEALQDWPASWRQAKADEYRKDVRT